MVFTVTIQTATYKKYMSDKLLQTPKPCVRCNQTGAVFPEIKLKPK